MEKQEVQLTSVKVLSDEYKKFKIKCLNGDTWYNMKMNLQTLVNKTLYLYNRDDEFRSLIHESFSTSGSIGL